MYVTLVANGLFLLIERAWITSLSSHVCSCTVCMCRRCPRYLSTPGYSVPQILRDIFLCGERVHEEVRRWEEFPKAECWVSKFPGAVAAIWCFWCKIWDTDRRWQNFWESQESVWDCIFNKVHHVECCLIRHHRRWAVCVCRTVLTVGHTVLSGSVSRMVSGSALSVLANTAASAYISGKWLTSLVKAVGPP